jgi:anti-sigma factor RsiW
VTDRHVSGDRISAFLDDELPEELASRVTHHLAACGACRAELDALRHTRDALRRLSAVTAPAPLLQPSAAAVPARLGRVTRRLVAASTGLAVVFGVAALAYLAGAEGGEVVPPVDLFLTDHVARTGGGPVPAPLGAIDR